MVNVEGELCWFGVCVPVWRMTVWHAGLATVVYPGGMVLEGQQRGCVKRVKMCVRD